MCFENSLVTLVIIPVGRETVDNISVVSLLILSNQGCCQDSTGTAPSLHLKQCSGYTHSLWQRGKYASPMAVLSIINYRHQANFFDNKEI